MKLNGKSRMKGLEKQHKEQFKFARKWIVIVAVAAVGIYAGISVLRKIQQRKVHTTSIGMRLVYVPAGEFMMGSRDSAAEVAKKAQKGGLTEEYYTREHPQHPVRISKGFYMGATEVTQAQWEAIMSSNPSRLKGDGLPVETVSWEDADEFCRKLSQKEGRKYRLPTEAEWEYACRAGTTTPFYTGETISTEQANYDGDYVYGSGQKGTDRRKTTMVGSFPPNPFGLYDMHGNVYEWCSDRYDKDYYSNSPTADPQGASTGSFRVLRGGSWRHDPWRCRSADRLRCSPDFRNNDLGFRVVVLDFQK